MSLLTVRWSNQRSIAILIGLVQALVAPSTPLQTPRSIMGSARAALGLLALLAAVGGVAAGAEERCSTQYLGDLSSRFTSLYACDPVSPLLLVRHLMMPVKVTVRCPTSRVSAGTAGLGWGRRASGGGFESDL